ncbi:ATP-binding cassette domain-containing protein [Massilia antarctica]|uniref:ATP-binding cassette domain-containing protein n=1 Tax=Massilia antarctica TaxID=2765360 RepID=A0AA48WB53_9BURK|nr:MULTISPECIES: ATP-binding cassette domain-containing protein [Massilia]MCY0912716.1 ATP-binding cassette domain-containing protein [Massilia sp. H27-R4]QPI49320.1 ATP-binding cassette domain-containing protein [Massilia antarctica]CUI03785.1 Phosphonate ABC transporter ATP-binding protein (TC 3.A.1.9.1) [Janthinobacterium sp. CG23_2]CUU27571.1 Phosphonate ABC transporter ATP-binding protein (TC 3.A.1.9.1) [Janthinobacterium sp. CG23_2]
MDSYRLGKLTVRHLAGTQAPALHEIDLAVAQGEQLAVIGPSGAGKTTLLATLACAHAPAGGTLHVLGQDPWALHGAARHKLRASLFLAPQTPPLPPRQRVVTAVLAARLPEWTLGQALASLFKPADPDAAHAALARFGLGDKLYARVDRLSGGERQRCGLARLLLSSARVFLVDEPLSALDPALSLITLATLRQEAARRNATLICSLHQVDMARAHFPRIVGLRDGRIVFDAAREDVSDDMIAALYRNEATVQHAPQPHETPDRLAVGACF